MTLKVGPGRTSSTPTRVRGGRDEEVLVGVVERHGIEIFHPRRASPSRAGGSSSLNSAVVLAGLPAPAGSSHDFAHRAPRRGS